LAASCVISIPAAGGEEGLRRVISLDGDWQIAEGPMAKCPEIFDRRAPVPGLADMARPPFAEVGVKSQRREAFWYRRRFRLEGSVPAVATVKLHKAMYGTRVVLNGTLLGDHLPCFTPGLFDARRALRTGENEIVVRVGAFRDAAGPTIPSGLDFEKKLYIPGIYDSVELILSGTPHLESVQVAPEIAAKTARVQAVVRNLGAARRATLRFVVREAKSQRTAGQIEWTGELAAGGRRTVDVRVPLDGCRLWSPEDPFLYELAVDSPSDRFETRFGMREFRFDPAAGRAVLNGQPYFLRGSNVCIFRFMEDAARQDLPWREDWVRRLHRRFKDFHWNCLRYCIGFPPESWYRIADEEGLLIEDEFPIWYGGKNWSSWPPALDRRELAAEYAEWMKERWNHPCVVIWDAQNETATAETGAAVRQVRPLDLSDRPWENGYGAPQAPGDVIESHSYHFQNPRFTLAMMAGESGEPRLFEAQVAAAKVRRYPVILNEYGWLWLNRDGTPTALTAELYKNLLGPDSTTQQRRLLYARYLAAETEFWRCHRQCAAVMHFCGLGYSRPDGATSDNWSDVEHLLWEPEFFRYVGDSFAPAGLMIDSWAQQYLGGARQEFPVVLINDLGDAYRGSVQFRLLSGGKVLEQTSRPCEIPPLGKKTMVFAVRIPRQGGPCQVEAALAKPGEAPVRSLRDFRATIGK
jgi:hypothetical protein